MSAQGSGQPGTAENPTHLDDQQSRALVAFLDQCVGPGAMLAHREVVNGRWVCFISHGDQEYCLLPLAFSKPPDVP